MNLWQKEDKKVVKRINELIKDIDRNGLFKGIGKPEL
ncbi:MAG: type II toxin-antitoxin system YoeB family toxin [Firmicutes bacterium]|nr:type II toxin-antitoxin system YoeB family toxin [Bacillota bacterium]